MESSVSDIDILNWIDTNIHDGLCECHYCSAYMIVMHVADKIRNERKADA
jgi:hypothetical protein